MTRPELCTLPRLVFAGYEVPEIPVEGCRYVVDRSRSPVGPYTPVLYQFPTFVEWLRLRDRRARYLVRIRRPGFAVTEVLIEGRQYSDGTRWLTLVIEGNPFPHYRVIAVYRVLDTRVNA